MKKFLWSLVGGGALVALAVTPAFAAMISSQLDMGSTGPDVTAVQTFLATNPLIYPEGLVTGYFGPLTRQAVMQYQIARHIPSVGRVGPQTMASLNTEMSFSSVLVTALPVISNTAVNLGAAGAGTATVTWTTAVPTTGRVYFDTKPLLVTEASDLSDPVVSGASVAASGSTRTSQSVSLSNLSANTTYYYVVTATDAYGNMSVASQGTFQTH